MNLLWAGLIVVGVAAVAITAMLLVRRTAPEGSYFVDGDRAAGVFGVIATGFAVLLGFVVFALIGGAVWLLMKSMNKHMKKVDFEEGSEPATASGRAAAAAPADRPKGGDPA